MNSLGTILLSVTALAATCCSPKHTSSVEGIPGPPVFAYYSAGEDLVGKVYVQKGNKIIGQWKEPLMSKDVWFLNSTNQFGVIQSANRDPIARFVPRFSLKSLSAIENGESERVGIDTEKYFGLTGIREEPIVVESGSGVGLRWLYYYTESERQQQRFEIWELNERSNTAKKVLSFEQICRKVGRKIPLGLSLVLGNACSSVDGSLFAFSVPQERAFDEAANDYTTDTWLWDRKTGSLEFIAKGEPVAIDGDTVIVAGYEHGADHGLDGSYVEAVSRKSRKVGTRITGVTQHAVLGSRIAIVTGWKGGGPSMRRIVQVWDRSLTRKFTEYEVAKPVTYDLVFASPEA